MELKNLLSVVVAALSAFGAILFAISSRSPWLATAFWLAAVISLVVTDFLRAVRLPRNLASLLMWGVLAVFLPYFVLQSSWHGRLQTVASILFCLQMTLLFQEKDARAYGWLAVMSLLEVVVATRYSQGVAFGGLLILYTIVGIFALSLLALFSQQATAGERCTPELDARRVPATGRWPLAGKPSSFASVPAGSGRSGVVVELFARLALIAIGALLLAAIIFTTAPRPRLPAWRGDSTRTVATVGFNDQIELGGLGETIDNPQEVMQLKLEDPATGKVYPLRDEVYEVYLRGSVVAWYSRNRWRRGRPLRRDAAGRALPPEDWMPEGIAADDGIDDAAFRIGPPIRQQMDLEPYLNHDDLFYIWPVVEPVEDRLLYSPATGQLARKPTWSGEPRGGHFECKVTTSGLVDGRQAPLVPASREVRVPPFLQMPDGGLPRLAALAARWLRESGLPSQAHYDIAHCFERQLSSSGQFQYSLQGLERDTSIDAIEDFVSNHPRGHCEYFATALALMLRSQGIPSRVVLGYRCDEWHEDQQCFQVRQLHAHAWVEAFLDEGHVPAGLRRGEPIRWMHGGWLRLDPTPADELGTFAAQRTLGGVWQGRWHALQRTWDKYIVDMDRIKQRESIYEPISRTMREMVGKLLSRRWWRELVAGVWASLAAKLRSGIMGWLLGLAALIVAVAVPLAALWWLVRRLGRFWRRFFKAGGGQSAGARSSIEFYRRFEQIAGRLGMRRRVGQTPREFARAAGTRLAALSGRRELYARAVQVAEAFYAVRFGRQRLAPGAVQSVEKALVELAVGAEKPPRG